MLTDTTFNFNNVLVNVEIKINVNQCFRSIGNTLQQGSLVKH